MEIPANENENHSTDVNKAESADRAQLESGDLRAEIRSSAIPFFSPILNPDVIAGSNPLGLRLRMPFASPFLISFLTISITQNFYICH